MNVPFCWRHDPFLFPLKDSPAVDCVLAGPGVETGVSRLARYCGSQGCLGIRRAHATGDPWAPDVGAVASAVAPRTGAGPFPSNASLGSNSNGIQGAMVFTLGDPPKKSMIQQRGSKVCACGMQQRTTQPFFFFTMAATL